MFVEINIDMYGRVTSESFDRAARDAKVVYRWWLKHGLRHHDGLIYVDDRAAIVGNFGRGKYIIIPDHEIDDLDSPEKTQDNRTVFEKYRDDGAYTCPRGKWEIIERIGETTGTVNGEYYPIDVYIAFHPGDNRYLMVEINRESELEPVDIYCADTEDDDGEPIPESYQYQEVWTLAWNTVEGS